MAPHKFGKMLGDIVVLKSGGPRMTVVAEDSNGIHCIWFNNGNGLESARFPAAVLVPWEKYVP